MATHLYTAVWTSFLKSSCENGGKSSEPSHLTWRSPGTFTTTVPSSVLHVMVGTGWPVAEQGILVPYVFKNVTSLGGSATNVGPWTSGFDETNSTGKKRNN